MIDVKKEFDAVEMTRKIRDDLYHQYEHLSMKDYARKIAEEGKNSELFKSILSRKDSNQK